MSNFDPRAFRNALGSFPTGVCVITTHREGGIPFGMTVNSFASVSLDPALVLWSIQNNSECFPSFETSDGFCVNVLAADQEDISNRYAKSGAHDLLEGDFQKGESGQAVIKGAVASFECKNWNRFEGGDHTILVGEVTHFACDSEKAPLLFHAGKYAQKA